MLGAAGFEPRLPYKSGHDELVKRCYKNKNLTGFERKILHMGFSKTLISFQELIFRSDTSFNH